MFQRLLNICNYVWRPGEIYTKITPEEEAKETETAAVVGDVDVMIGVLEGGCWRTKLSPGVVDTQRKGEQMLAGSEFRKQKQTDNIQLKQN